MKKLFVFVLLNLIITDQIFSQNSDARTFEIQAITQVSPASIKLKWQLTAYNAKITIRRKLKEDTSWGSSSALPDNTIEYTDNSVLVGKVYEYHLSASLGAYTYISVGINVPLVDYRGKVLLVIEKSIETPLADEINRWMMDVKADGWQVIKIEVNKTDQPSDVRTLIRNAYNLDKVNTKAVFVFGQVPQPLSGCLMPDMHSDHYGAWATDTYYADVDGTWTDATANCTGNFNANIPGDGKFDQNTIPSSTELQAGRVDMRNLPVFTETETELLRRYLNKDHNFRINNNFFPREAYILDFFAGETGAMGGYYLFKSQFGLAKTHHVGASDIRKGNSLWMYACAGGQPDGFEDLTWGSTDYFMSSNFANEQFNYVFTMLFGSYFGDYQFTNDFMRAALASRGSILTCCWGGRPAQYYHHITNGENIGYCARINNNCPGLYAESGQGIYVNLLGDPTLRQDMIRTPLNVKSGNVSNHIKITWSPPTSDSIEGYHVYKAKHMDSVFIRLTSTGITDTFWTDPAVADPTYYYMVKAYRLEKNRCGSYYNTSRGIVTSNDVSVKEYQPIYIVLKPYLKNPIPDQKGYIKKSFYYVIPKDVFGDDNPDAILTYQIYKADSTALPKGWSYTTSSRSISVSPQPAKPIKFKVVYKVIDGDKNFVTDTFEINIIDTTKHVVLPEISGADPLGIYPNPATISVKVSFYSECNCSAEMTAVDITGKKVLAGNIAAVEGSNEADLSLESLADGIYFISVKTTGHNYKGRVVVSR
jgi:hypothetical protein